MCKKPLDVWIHPTEFKENGAKKVLFNPPLSKSGYIHTFMECGRCIDCRLKKSKVWAVRCLNELEYWNEACFVTLTYNDFTLPKLINTDTGEIKPSIFREHIREFNKRLRRHFDKIVDKRKIKIYYCGEYGSKTGRPHYHLLIFGFKPTDLHYYRHDKLGFPLYNSRLLDSLWYQKYDITPKKDYYRHKYLRMQRGYVVVGDVSFNSCAYVARYILKKQQKDSERYEAQNQEFLGTSNGIGKRWFYDNYKTMYANGFITYKKGDNFFKCPIPKYYDKLLKEHDLNLYQKVKAERLQYLLDVGDSLNFEDLYSQEKCLEFKNNHILRRNLE